MEAKIRKIGNSLGIILPRDILDAMGIIEGGSIDVSIKNKKLILILVKK